MALALPVHWSGRGESDGPDTIALIRELAVFAAKRVLESIGIGFVCRRREDPFVRRSSSALYFARAGTGGSFVASCVPMGLSLNSKPIAFKIPQKL